MNRVTYVTWVIVLSMLGLIVAGCVLINVPEEQNTNQPAPVDTTIDDTTDEDSQDSNEEENTQETDEDNQDTQADDEGDQDNDTETEEENSEDSSNEEDNQDEENEENTNEEDTQDNQEQDNNQTQQQTLDDEPSTFTIQPEVKEFPTDTVRIYIVENDILPGRVAVIEGEVKIIVENLDSVTHKFTYRHHSESISESRRTEVIEVAPGETKELIAFLSTGEHFLYDPAPGAATRGFEAEMWIGASHRNPFVIETSRKQFTTNARGKWAGQQISFDFMRASVDDLEFSETIEIDDSRNINNIGEEEYWVSEELGGLVFVKESKYNTLIDMFKPR